VSATDTLDREAGAVLALVTPPEGRDALSVFAATDTKAADDILAMVRSQIDGFLAVRPDVSTRAGRDLIRAFANRVTKSKTAIEEVGAALAKEQKEIPKRIDATRRLFKDTLDAWRDEVRQPLSDWEAAEEARVTQIKDGLAALQGTIDDPSWVSRSSEQLRDRLGEVERDGDVSEGRWDEYAPAAAELRTKAIEVLTERVAVAEKREAEAAELDRLRKELGERERQDRERKIAEDAAAKAKADAADALARSERERAAAEERAAKAEETARARAAAEVKARADAEAAETARREQDRAHKATVNRAALDALISGGLTEDIAKTVITLIATGKVPAVTIRY
jgi:chromosome segregation ATPase